MLYRVQHDGHGFVYFFTHTSYMYVRLATLCHSVVYPAAVCSSVRPSHVTAEDEYIKNHTWKACVAYNFNCIVETGGLINVTGNQAITVEEAIQDNIVTKTSNSTLIHDLSNSAISYDLE